MIRPLLINLLFPDTLRGYFLLILFILFCIFFPYPKAVSVSKASYSLMLEYPKTIVGRVAYNREPSLACFLSKGFYN